MREELEKIVKSLGDFCKKYNKEYISISFVEGSLIANTDTKDKDYEELKIFIEKDKED